ncbi:MAG: type II secretion system protein [Planctomycetes bacterium]|nr:type II secretion system protein [Planctomycetota bacterium]
MRVHRAVTLTEMLAVTGGLACLTALLLPVLRQAKDAGDRAACAANLAHLGQALVFYAQDHDGYLPDCGAASTLGGLPPADGRHFPSRWNAPGTCNWPHVRRVGNQANLWLLVRGGYADPRMLVCPATADRPSLNCAADPAVMGFLATAPDTGRATAAEDRFLRRIAAGRCSYSYQNQFAHPGIDPEEADPRNATTHILQHPASLAVLADRNPYTRTDLVRQPVLSAERRPQANSLNHHEAGQNVLYLGGEVEWHDTPLCGAIGPDGEHDDIYAPERGDIADPQNIPRSATDSYLVP